MKSWESWGQIAEVALDLPSTWAGRTFVTFDMDWASDEVMRYTHAFIIEAGVPSTWFVTHESSILDELRADPNIELGIHPNFNKLLEGDHSNGRTVEEVIARLLEVVPEAKSARSHSLLQSSRILDAYAGAGLTHDANHFVDPSASVRLRPWRHWNGLVRVPLAWADDVACIQRPGAPLLEMFHREELADGIRVCLFHPIHVFLNTEAVVRYERARNFLDDPGRLVIERSTDAGIATLLNELLIRPIP